MKLSKLIGNTAVTLFIVVQVADWMATYQGVVLFGTDIEANPMLRLLMERYDIIFTLTAAKVFATIAGSFLHLFNRHLEVATLTILYMMFAVVPWIKALPLSSVF